MTEAAPSARTLSRDSTGRFLPGSGGRPRGRPNKITRELRAVLHEALAEAGGREYLTALARERPELFVPLLARLIPAEVRAELARADEHVLRVIDLSPQPPLPARADALPLPAGADVPPLPLPARAGTTPLPLPAPAPPSSVPPPPSDAPPPVIEPEVVSEPESEELQRDRLEDALRHAREELRLAYSDWVAPPEWHRGGEKSRLEAAEDRVSDLERRLDCAPRVHGYVRRWETRRRRLDGEWEDAE